MTDETKAQLEYMRRITEHYRRLLSQTVDQIAHLNTKLEMATEKIADLEDKKPHDAKIEKTK